MYLKILGRLFLLQLAVVAGALYTTIPLLTPLSVVIMIVMVLVLAHGLAGS